MFYFSNEIYLQTRDRLPSLIEEILRIGTDEATSEAEASTESTIKSLYPERGSEEICASDIPAGDGKEKQIEDYPRPLAVVGVSVL